jgi:Holliday junction resolvasome RuvABC DNA-binding subunit
LRALQRIRDEAHRFAITYHKRLRTRRTLVSVLDQIPGVGPALRTNLLRSLGSARAVREASVAQLAAVPKVTPKLAQRIHDFFHPALAAAEPPSEASGYPAEVNPPKGGETMKALAMTLAVLALTAGPALGFQCPLLIKQIQDATAGKTDEASRKATALANEAKMLHDQGKHAESVAKADEAAKVINLTLKKK